MHPRLVNIQTKGFHWHYCGTKIDGRAFNGDATQEHPVGPFHDDGYLEFPSGRTPTLNDQELNSRLIPQECP